MDIRHSFINSLDHFPSELVRTLWTIQSLDMKCDKIQNADCSNDDIIKLLRGSCLQQAIYLEKLVERQRQSLLDYKNELLVSYDIKKRYEKLLKRTTASETRSYESPIPKGITEKNRKNKGKHRGKRFLVKLNLKKYKDDLNSQIRQDILNESLKVNQLNPDEPRYCICNDVSYGQMIACDNEKCPTEWFHYGCIGITKAPSEEWFCSDSCRQMAKKQGDKQNVTTVPELSENSTPIKIKNKQKKKRRRRFY